MSRENTSPLPHGDGEGRRLASSPVCGSVVERGVARYPGPSVAAFFVPCGSACKQRGGNVPTMVLSETRGLWLLLGCPMGHTVARETHCLTRPGILTLEPVRSAAGRSHASVKLARSFGAERLGCLWLQLLGVEAFSFLPNAQGYGSDLPRQRQARHRRPHAFGQQTFIELPERPVHNAGRRGRTRT